MMPVRWSGEGDRRQQNQGKLAADLAMKNLIKESQVLWGIGEEDGSISSR